MCIVGKMAQKYCGAIPILFSWFSRVPSLHALVFAQKTFLSLVSVAFFLGMVRKKERERKEVGGEAKGKMQGL